MNCKPGDLAIIISTDYLHQDCLGKLVEVIGPLPGTFARHHWECKFLGPVPDSLKGLPQVGGADDSLRPVSGLPMEEETEQKLKEPA